MMFRLPSNTIQWAKHNKGQPALEITIMQRYTQPTKLSPFAKDKNQKAFSLENKINSTSKYFSFPLRAILVNFKYMPKQDEVVGN